MGKDPPNITRLKRENDRLAAANHHDRDLQICNGNAKWFSRDYEQANRTELTTQTKTFAGKESSVIERHKVGDKDMIVQELDSANQIVKALRKDKLRDLFARERQEHEAELNAMGLAFDKHRD